MYVEVELIDSAVTPRRTREPNFSVLISEEETHEDLKTVKEKMANYYMGSGRPRAQSVITTRTRAECIVNVEVHLRVTFDLWRSAM